MNNLIDELIKGREVARQLQLHLNNMPSSSSSSSSSSPQTLFLTFLIQNILALYENALSLINTLPSCTKQVRVIPGFGLEDSLDDGFNWRKFDHKHILGSKFPRGYYKCTDRNGEGCLATKQVQRSDEDPTIFQVMYRGIHTCSQANSSDSNTMIPSTDFNYNQDPQNVTNSQLFESFNSSFNFDSTTSLNNMTYLNDGLLGFMSDNNIVSPTNDYFNVSQDHVMSTSGLEINQNLQINNSDSEIAEIITDFPFGHVSDFDPNFNFANPPFFF